ncbi:hypothetical protein BH20ACI4_BH20ACI4_30710 [soil metagenome]
MKTLYIIIIIVASAFFCLAQIPKTTENSFSKFHNKIDDIKNDTDIDKLLDSISKKQFEVFIVKNKLEIKNKECKEFSEKVQAKSWSKADFDNNGYTDILITADNFGISSIVIIDEGKNNFAVKSLTGILSYCSFPSIENVQTQTTIVYHEFSKFQPTEKRLIYKYGDFIEINDSSETYKIEKIEYKTTGCYGNCSVFEMIIDSNRQAIYKPFAYNKKKKGTFRGIIKEAQYQELVGLLSYIDFPNLQDEYLSGGTDQQNSYLTVTYNGGKIKQVMDYSLDGTFGLRRLHKILFDLRENQRWK